jgi:hypothetical protein
MSCQKDALPPSADGFLFERTPLPGQRGSQSFLRAAAEKQPEKHFYAIEQDFRKRVGLLFRILEALAKEVPAFRNHPQGLARREALGF